MKTSKSPRKVLQVAYALGREVFAPYAHRFSPKKFTQAQLFACLALKEFLKLDYRGVQQLLLDTSDLRAVIELRVVPHWTTLQKAADRLLKKTPRISFSLNRFASRNVAASSRPAPRGGPWTAAASRPITSATTSSGAAPRMPREPCRK